VMCLKYEIQGFKESRNVSFNAKNTPNKHKHSNTPNIPLAGDVQLDLLSFLVLHGCALSVKGRTNQRQGPRAPAQERTETGKNPGAVLTRKERKAEQEALFLQFGG
jgi:hypothetical protein